MAKAFIKNLSQCIYEEYLSPVPRKELRESFSEAVQNLPGGKLQNVLNRNFNKHLNRLEKKLENLCKAGLPDMHVSVDDSLEELTSELDTRTDDHHVAEPRKHHILYSVMAKHLKLPKEDELASFSDDQKIIIYCGFLKRALASKSIAEKKIRTVVEQVSSLLNMSDSDDKSRFDWLPTVQVLVQLTTGSPPLAIIRLLKILFQSCEDDVNNCIEKNKSVRSGKLAEIIKTILINCHIRTRNKKLGDSFSQMYCHCMSALCSYYIDLCCVHASKIQKKKKYGREICGFVSFLLQHWPETLLEVALQMTKLETSTINVVLPLISKCLSLKPVEGRHLYYLKYVLLVRKVKDSCEENDTITEWIVLTRMIPADNKFLSWLEDTCPSAANHLPIEDKKFRKTRVTRFLLEEASEDLISLLYESMCSQEVEEDTDDLEVTSGFTMETGESSQGGAELFYLDTGGSAGVQELSGEPSASSDETQDKIPQLLKSIEELEGIVDEKNEDDAKSFVLDPRLISECVRDPEDQKFFENTEIVSITKITDTEDDEEFSEQEEYISDEQEENDIAENECSGSSKVEGRKNAGKKGILSKKVEKNSKKKNRSVDSSLKGEVKSLMKSGLKIINSETENSEDYDSVTQSEDDNLQMKSVVRKVSPKKLSSPMKVRSPKKVIEDTGKDTQSIKTSSDTIKEPQKELKDDIKDASIILIEDSEDEHKLIIDNEVNDEIPETEEEQMMTKHNNTAEDESLSDIHESEVEHVTYSLDEEDATIVESDNDMVQTVSEKLIKLGKKESSSEETEKVDSSVVTVESETSPNKKRSPRKKQRDIDNSITSDVSSVNTSATTQSSDLRKSHRQNRKGSNSPTKISKLDSTCSSNIGPSDTETMATDSFTIQTETTTSIVSSADESNMDDTVKYTGAKTLLESDVDMFVDSDVSPRKSRKVLQESPKKRVNSSRTDSPKKSVKSVRGESPRKSAKSPSKAETSQKTVTIINEKVMDTSDSEDEESDNLTSDIAEKRNTKKTASDDNVTEVHSIEESDEEVFGKSPEKKTSPDKKRSAIEEKFIGKAIKGQKTPKKMKTPQGKKVNEMSKGEISKSAETEIQESKTSDKRTKSTEEIVNLVEQIKEKIKSPPRRKSLANENKNNDSMFTDDSIESVGSLSEEDKPSSTKESLEKAKTPKKLDGKTPKKSESKTPRKSDSKTPRKSDNKTPGKSDKETAISVDKKTPKKTEKNVSQDSKTPSKLDKKTPKKSDSKTPNKSDKETPKKISKTPVKVESPKISDSNMLKKSQTPTQKVRKTPQKDEFSEKTTKSAENIVDKGKVTPEDDHKDELNMNKRSRSLPKSPGLDNIKPVSSSPGIPVNKTPLKSPTRGKKQTVEIKSDKSDRKRISDIREQTDSDEDDFVPSSQKKNKQQRAVNSKSPAKAKGKMILKIEELDKDSDDEIKALPNIQQYLKSPQAASKANKTSKSTPDKNKDDQCIETGKGTPKGKDRKIDLKSPHIPVLSTVTKEVPDGDKDIEDSEEESVKNISPPKTRRTLRARNVAEQALESESDSNASGPTRTKRPRMLANQKTQAVTEPKSTARGKGGKYIKKSSDGGYSETDTTDHSDMERRSTRKSVGAKMTVIKEKAVEIDSDDPAPKTPDSKPKMRKLSASTSKKAVKRVETLKGTRKRRLSGELSEQGNSTDAEIDFPKLKKVIAPVEKKTSRRVSAPPVPQKQTPGDTAAGKRYGLRKK